MTRPSLLHKFEAPPGFEGTFGWICGFSADGLFLGDAAERFTRRTANQRARDGHIALAVMLDPCHEPLSTVDVPAIADLPIIDFEGREFRLLHAKVALLGFRRLDGEGWFIRLVVSTGNWTQQTVEDSLDLGWSIEVHSAEVSEEPDDAEDLALRCADVRAAANLLAWIRERFDTRLLEPRSVGGAGPTAQACEQLDAWLAACAEAAGPRQRFFDSRSGSLLSQLVPLIGQHAPQGARNFLALGSGFYEAPTSKGDVPSVLVRIEETLREAKLLTQAPRVHVYVNEDACQAVATSMLAIQKRGWQVFAPARSEALYGRDSRRALHAKFLFSGWWRDNNCSRIWMYLGSGNLTGPGFCSRISLSSGNLEAGVVFGVSSLPWLSGESKGNEEVDSITLLLPLHYEGTPLSAQTPPDPGAAMPERAQPFVALPVAWLQWQDAEGGGTLSLPAAASAEGLEVLAIDRQPCPRAAGCWRWAGSMPRQVTVRWSGVERATPVVDAFGRIAAGVLPVLQLEDIGALLESFPALPPSEDLTEDFDPATDLVDGSPPGEQIAAEAAQTRSPMVIRSMMLQLERIAQIQTEIEVQDWEAWCHRLEQTLVQAAASTTLEAFRSLGINPLSALLNESFRPDYAVDANTLAGKAYEDAIARVGEAWKVNSLLELGGL
ncbi:hypothetical protein [Comamonas sp. UBA7528]|uniref:hypothetical protein n=1 Tax=Comamonas sp. UBA7528 TaxID=1946391 RepID=UPI0025C12CEC|nr:hypothetical protein [Comamonas sp. UBA7528]